MKRQPLWSGRTRPRFRPKECTVKKLAYILPVALVMMAAAAPVLAQDGGCVDSPENPTAILALIGAAAVGVDYLRNRFRKY